MRAFLLKTGIALLLAIGLYAWAGTFANGTFDGDYLRFTTPRQHSLILGGSRAARGLHPDVIEQTLGQGSFEGPLYNFSFDIDHSPFGPTYLNAIKAKLEPDTRNGLFIIEVDGWLLGAARDAPNDTARFQEKDRTLGQQLTFNMRPNYEYLIRHRDRGWGALMRPHKVWAMLRDDGRLHVLPGGTDGERVLQEHIKEYGTERLPTSAYSAAREEFLRRTLVMLKEHGRVVMVRLPVVPSLKVFEDSLCLDLDERMNRLAERTGTRFVDLNYLNGRVTYDDGSHLNDTSGAFVSKQVAAFIANVFP